ncbi:MAG: GDP-mannose 4,6-dehydratase, partial [Novosphingobium sp.]
MKILVTGGAGFIGSTLVRQLIRDSDHEILNLDKLTYAGVHKSLHEVADNPRHEFVQGDICDAGLVADLLTKFQPDTIAHLAAES